MTANRRRRMPDHVLAIDAYLDDLADAGVAKFTARDIAERIVDRQRPRPTGRLRARQIDDMRGRVSMWLQQYWQRQLADSYRYVIACETWGPDAYWTFDAPDNDGDLAAARRNIETRIRKNLTVAFGNAIERSVTPLMPDDDERRQRLAGNVQAGIDLLADEVMAALNGGPPA